MGFLRLSSVDISVPQSSAMKGTVYIENGYIKIPKLKSMIKINQHREFDGLIKSCTISQTPSGKYFISILVDTLYINIPWI